MSEHTNPSDSDSEAKFLGRQKTLSMEKNASECRQRHVATFVGDILRYPLMAIAFVVGLIIGLFAETIEWLKEGSAKEMDLRVEVAPLPQEPDGQCISESD